MEDNLQTKIAEAKAQGYTDEQIDAYLNPQPVLDVAKENPGTQPGMFRTPAIGGQTSPTGPVSPWVDRSEESTGVLQYGAGKAAELGLELGGGYYAAKKLLGAAGNSFRGGPPPTPPTSAPSTFSGGANAAFDQALSKPYAPPAEPQPTMIQKATDMASKIRQMAGEKALAVGNKVAPVASAAAPYIRGATGVGSMLYSGGLNTNEADELRKFREQQAMAARQQGY